MAGLAPRPGLKPIYPTSQPIPGYSTPPAPGTLGPMALNTSVQPDPGMQEFQAGLKKRIAGLEEGHDETTRRMVNRETTAIADRSAGAAAALKESQAARGASESGGATAERAGLSDDTLRAQDRAENNIETDRAAQKEASLNQLYGLYGQTAGDPARLALAQAGMGLEQFRTMTGNDIQYRRLANDEGQQQFDNTVRMAPMMPPYGGGWAPRPGLRRV